MSKQANESPLSLTEALGWQFEFARDSTIRLLGEFDEETARWRPTPHNNNAHWLAGHLLTCGDDFRKFLEFPPRKGGPVVHRDFGFGGHYDKSKDYVSYADISAALVEERDELLGLIRGMTLKDLARQTGGELGEFCPRHIEVVSLWISHENIHNGQMYFLRRGLGKEPLIK
jgi:hypothetical protein